MQILELIQESPERSFESLQEPLSKYGKKYQTIIYLDHFSQSKDKSQHILDHFAMHVSTKKLGI